MRSAWQSWWKSPVGNYSLSERRVLHLERLEERTLLTGDTLGTASLLSFPAFGTVQVGAVLSHPNDVDLYKVKLDAGDRIRVAVSAQAAGSELVSLLRVFNSAGQQLLLNNQEGGDPQVTFQASTTGCYFLGISSAGDCMYNPTLTGSGTNGSTTGQYTLTVRLTQAATPQADLTGDSFRLQTETAAYGETVSGKFTIENQGGAASSGFSVQLVLWTGPTFTGFDPDQPLSAIFVSAVPAELAAGQAFTTSFTAPLPDAPPPNFPTSGPLYLGLVITPNDPAADFGAFDKSGVHRGEDWETLSLVTPVTAVSGGVTDLSQADAGLNTRVTGSLLMSTQADTYTFTVPDTPGAGRLTAEVMATGGSLVPRLTLYALDASSNPVQLIHSDDGSIVQQLPPGQYTLKVSAVSGTGSYRLLTEFVQADSLLRPLPVGNTTAAMVLADLTGNGILDIVAANENDGTVSVLFGNGDGSFQPARSFPVGAGPTAVAVADLNGDGIPDIVVANSRENDIGILLGNGNGTFQTQQAFGVGGDPSSVAVADLNGDGILDIVTANYASNDVSVLINTSAPGANYLSFNSVRDYPAGLAPSSVVVADLTGDGIPDIAVANYKSNNVTVLQGNGSGGIGTEQTVKVGANPAALTVADLNGDGKLDLLVANAGANSVSVLLNATVPGSGLLTFAAQQTFPVGAQPFALTLADLTNDGNLDLVVADSAGNAVSVLLGNGNGTFGAQQTFSAGSSPRSVAVADLNGDGTLDLVVGNYNGNTVTILQGSGKGSFQPQDTLTVGSRPDSVALADLTGDGKLDMVVANYLSNTVSVLLGNGDGTFQPQHTYSVGAGPTDVVVADVNGDGRPDLIVADYGSKKNPTDTVSVLLGDGDGTFQRPRTFTVGKGPFAVAVADLNGDGKPDLIVANSGTNTDVGDTVSVLLGNGDGTFKPQHAFTVGSRPFAVAVGDLNGDGKLDIVTANAGTFSNPGSTVSVLPGKGDGTFGPAQDFNVGSRPKSVALADLNGDGKLDIVTADYNASFSGNYYACTVSVLLNETAARAHVLAFNTQPAIPVGNGPLSVVVADLNGDGTPDLVTVNYEENDVSVLLNETIPNTDSVSFSVQPTIPVGSTTALPAAGAVGDINGDGQPDIVVVNAGDNTVTALLNQGLAQFQQVSVLTCPSSPDIPRYEDLTGDNIPDAVSLTSSGQILFRQGVNDSKNPFLPVVVVNPDNPAIDFTLVRTQGSFEIAAIDALDNAVSLYVWSSTDQAFHRIGTVATGQEPVRIASDDLTKNGLGDLVIDNYLDQTVTIAFQLADGSGLFDPNTRTCPVGAGPSNISFTPATSGGEPAIVVSNQTWGDVTIIEDPTGDQSFSTEVTYPAGQGPYAVSSGPAGPVLVSNLQTVGAVAAYFTSSNILSLVTLNGNPNSFSLLRGEEDGSFSDPQVADTYSVPSGAIQILAGDFLDDGGSDLAILTVAADGASQILIYANTGGTFVQGPSSINAGEGATGFSFVAGTNGQPGRFLVGDAFGDVLILLGDGQGHFSPDRSALTGEQLAAGTTTTGQQFVVLADQGQDAVRLYLHTPGTAGFAGPYSIAGNTQALLAPAAVQLINLNNNGIPDLVVADELSNAILVYPGLAGGGFGAPTSFAVGDEPVAVTAAYLKGDSVLDLAVVNKGSNDVSILLGRIDPATGLWTETEGPRLKTGEVAPTAIAAGKFSRTGLTDLRVTNQDGQIVTLPAIGSSSQSTGFFNDTNLQPLNLAANIVQAVFDPNTDEEFLVLSGGQLDVFNGTTVTTLLPSGVAVISVAAGELVVGLENGNVEMLPEAGGSPELQPGLFADEPSALQVLQDGNRLDVFLTYAGQESPFFYSFVLPVVTNVPPTVSVAEAIALPDASLLLLTVLVPGDQGEGTTGPTFAFLEAQSSGPAGNQVIAAIGLAPLPHNGNVSADGDKDGTINGEATGSPVYQMGVDETMHWLREKQHNPRHGEEFHQGPKPTLAPWWGEPQRLQQQEQKDVGGRELPKSLADQEIREIAVAAEEADLFARPDLLPQSLDDLRGPADLAGLASTLPSALLTAWLVRTRELRRRDLEDKGPVFGRLKDEG